MLKRTNRFSVNRQMANGKNACSLVSRADQFFALDSAACRCKEFKKVNFFKNYN